MPDQPTLFDSPRARRTDPATSHAAAQAIEEKLGSIQRLVLRVYQERGPMSARQAERLDDFAAYGFSTIRKRISELAQAGYLVACGTESEGRTPATVYRVTPTP